MENLYIFFIKNTHFCKGCCLLHYVNRNGAKIEVLMFSFIYLFFFFLEGESGSSIKDKKLHILFKIFGFALFSNVFI